MKKVFLTVVLLAASFAFKASADPAKISACSWSSQTGLGLQTESFKICVSSNAEVEKIFVCGMVSRLGQLVGSPNAELFVGCLQSPADVDTIGACKEATDNFDESRDTESFISCLHSN